MDLRGDPQLRIVGQVGASKLPSAGPPPRSRDPSSASIPSAAAVLGQRPQVPRRWPAPPRRRPWASGGTFEAIRPRPQVPRRRPLLLSMVDLARIHRRTALGTVLEEAIGCASESRIMVLKQKTGPRKGAPDRCYHVTTPDRIQIAFDDHRLVANAGLLASSARIGPAGAVEASRTRRTGATRPKPGGLRSAVVSTVGVRGWKGLYGSLTEGCPASAGVSRRGIGRDRRSGAILGPSRSSPAPGPAVDRLRRSGPSSSSTSSASSAASKLPSTGPIPPRRRLPCRKSMIR